MEYLGPIKLTTEGASQLANAKTMYMIARLHIKKRNASERICH